MASQSLKQEPSAHIFANHHPVSAVSSGNDLRPGNAGWRPLFPRHFINVIRGGRDLARICLMFNA
jgi:hypothetical protein